jgi:hypothetical protein
VTLISLVAVWWHSHKIPDGRNPIVKVLWQAAENKYKELKEFPRP